MIEDTCDAVGATFDGKPVGSFGDLATTSFYPAHHITMGEGGCVLTDNPILEKIVESLRDWGRDCWCPPGCDNTCGRRFDWQLGGLPYGYDHKYTYSHIGYNLKMTDMQAAVGVSQLAKLTIRSSKPATEIGRCSANAWNRSATSCSCRNERPAQPQVGSASRSRSRRQRRFRDTIL